MLRKMGKVMFVALMISVICCGTLYAKPGPTKLMVMTRFEGHTDTATNNPSAKKNNKADFSGETYGYQMFSATRLLDKNVLGNLFYLYRYSFDTGKSASNIAGLNIIKIYTPRLNATLGYSFVANNERNAATTTTNLCDGAGADRFCYSDSDSLSLNLNYALSNPKKKSGPSYSISGNWSLPTNFGGAGTRVSVKPAVKIPLTKRMDTNLSYQYVYDVKNTDQVNNQYTLNLNYQINKKEKLTLEYLFIDNMTTGIEDDNVGRLSYTINIR